MSYLEYKKMVKMQTLCKSFYEKVPKLVKTMSNSLAEQKYLRYAENQLNEELVGFLHFSTKEKKMSWEGHEWVDS